jgi:hypothetical protein
LYTEKEKGGTPDRKPHPLPYGLRDPYRNLKSENSQEGALSFLKMYYILTVLSYDYNQQVDTDSFSSKGL